MQFSILEIKEKKFIDASEDMRMQIARRNRVKMDRPNNHSNDWK